MFQSKKFWLSFALLALCVSCVLFSQAGVARAERDDHGISCVMEVVVESRNQTGVLVSTETYQKEFILQDADTFFDDFSTRVRFKFFNASHARSNGEDTVMINWFADVTVFNSVDFNTAVTLSHGQKSGQSAGNHTFYNSSGHTTTRYSLTCTRN